MILKFGGMPFEVLFIFEPTYLDKFYQMIFSHNLNCREEADGYTIEEFPEDEEYKPTVEKLQLFFKDLKESGEWHIDPHFSVEVYADNAKEEKVYLAFVHNEVIENALYD